MWTVVRRRLTVLVAALPLAIGVELAAVYVLANADLGGSSPALPAAKPPPAGAKRPNVAALLSLTGKPWRTSEGVPGIDEQPLFVNMIDSLGKNRYEIGRFDAGSAVERATIAPTSGACHLWSPSAIRGRNEVWLYAAEHDCDGWHRIVLFRSSDGGHTFMRHGVVFTTKDQLRMPTIVYHGGRFHLWYTIDRGGLGRALAYAHSEDGLRFVRHGVKVWAGDLNALAVTYAFRVGEQWRLLVATYDKELRTASPRLFGFTDPRGDYRLLGELKVQRVAPKVDASLVCRDPRGGWRGIFTAYGAPGQLFAHEWTVVYRAPRLLGPWQPDLDVRSPYLRLSNAGPKTSVENPDVPRSGAGVFSCGMPPADATRDAVEQTAAAR